MEISKKKRDFLHLGDDIYMVICSEFETLKAANNYEYIGIEPIFYPSILNSSEKTRALAPCRYS